LVDPGWGNHAQNLSWETLGVMFFSMHWGLDSLKAEVQLSKSTELNTEDQQDK